METTMQQSKFKVGDRVRYLGQSKSESGQGFDPVMKPLIFPKMEATITKVYLPREGMGFMGHDEDGEPWYDHDENGCAAYTNEFGNSRLIHVEDENNWEII